MNERKRVKVKYLSTGFETEYYEDVAVKLEKKGKIMILKNDFAKLEKKKPEDKKPEKSENKEEKKSVL